MPKLQNLKIIILIFAAVGIFVFPAFALASPNFRLEVTPAVIDEKGKKRDIFKESLVIENTSKGKLDVYTFVNNISIEDGKQEFLSLAGADLADSLANWIEIPRSMLELGPGESKKIDFKIQINLRAEPGEYHALISFADGSTRSEAEQKLKESPSIMVNIEVEEDIVEYMQLINFFPEKSIMSSPATFFYNIENIGNQTLIPSGEIRIYDSRGREIASAPINKNMAAIEPGSAARLSSVWIAEKEIGRYKAVFNLEYGKKQRGNLQDTVYFWLIPQKEFLLVILTLIFGNIFFVIIWRYGYNLRQSRPNCNKNQR